MACLPVDFDALFSELAPAVFPTAGLCAEAARSVVNGVAAYIQQLETLLNTDESLHIYIHESFTSDIFNDQCDSEACTGIRTFIRRVVFSQPGGDASSRVAGVLSSLEYLQQTCRHLLASYDEETSRLHPSTSQSPAWLSQPSTAATPVYFASLGHLPAENVTASARRRRPPHPPVMRVDPRTFAPPLQFGDSQAAWERWDASPESQNVQSLPRDELVLLLDLLAAQKTFSDFHARATGGDKWRSVAELFTELYFHEVDCAIATSAIPSVDKLFNIAPAVTRLTINTPFAPSLSELWMVPDLEYLCIDEGHRALSRNRMTMTLEALQAQDVLDLHIRNASVTTVEFCLKYMGKITSAGIADDGDTRYTHIVDDDRRMHTYVGSLVADSRFLFARAHTRNLVSLTLCEWMAAGDLEQLFKSFPRGLEDLQVLYGADHRSLMGAMRLLTYRAFGEGRCKALRTLTLSATPPPELVMLLRAAPMPIERHSLVAEFLLFIHGSNIDAVREVKLVQDGVLVI